MFSCAVVKSASCDAASVVLWESSGPGLTGRLGRAHRKRKGAEAQVILEPEDI